MESAINEDLGDKTGDYLSPKVDFVFRKLFGSDENKDILMSLINSIVEPVMHVTDITIKNPYNFATYVGSKSSILDIKAVDQDGVWYDIEMQIAGKTCYGKRALYYLSKVYVDQLHEGMAFRELHKTIGIHLIDFDHFNDARYVRRFLYKDADTNETDEELEYMQLYFVEMRKAQRLGPGLANPLVRWIKFLNEAQNFNQSTLPEDIVSDPDIARALSKLERMGLNEEEQKLYETEAKADVLELDELDYAREEGIKQGRQIGEQLGLQRGEQLGLQRGEELGLQRGKEKLVVRLISRRVGAFPEALADKLDQLSAAELDDLGEALLDFTSLSEVEAWLAARA